MADLTELQATLPVKIAGANPSTGVEDNFLEVNSDGSVSSRLKDGNGVSVPLGQATMAASLPVVDPSNGTNNAAIPTVSTLVGGSDGTNLHPLATDSQGRLVTSAITGFGANFTFGDTTLSSSTLAAVRRTTYTEQASNAQRSLVSASALDTAAGTGARTVKITYYDSTGAGPSTETVTLNGTVAVNTVSTTICYIEKIEVVTAGSTGSNAGIVTLKAATAGGGATIGTIGATDNQTFWCHHYIPAGKICNITGFSVNHNGTTVGSGGVFIIKSIPFTVANAIEKQVGDFHRLYGQASTSGRIYGSPIQVTGPARILAYVTPETGSATVYRASIDFFEP